jgi:hypothetical protein
MQAKYNATFWRRLFLTGALFNWGAAALLAFGYQDLVRTMGVTPAGETQLFVHVSALAIAFFGWAYYMVSRDLGQLALVRLGAWSKVAVVALIWGHWGAGLASWHLPVLASGDVAFAAFFFVFLRKSHS